MATTVNPYKSGERILALRLDYSTGTEAAPTTDPTVGLLLERNFLFLHVEASAAMTANGKFNALLWNPHTLRWNPVSDGSLDLTVQAVQYQGFPGFNVAPGQRITYVPNGVGVSCSLYMFM